VKFHDKVCGVVCSLKENTRGLCKGFEGPEEDRKRPFMTAGNSAVIRTGYLLIASKDRYRYINLLGKEMI
jgi:hypothetical protein